MEFSMMQKETILLAFRFDFDKLLDLAA